MPASRPRLPLDRAVRLALVEALKLKLPPGQPLTIDTLEAATSQLLRELGPQLMEDVIQGVDSPAKKGALPGAVTTRPSAKGSKPAR